MKTNRIFLGVIGLLIAVFCSINYAIAGGNVTIINKTKAPLYCYNQDFGANKPAIQIMPFPIPVKGHTNFKLVNKMEQRIYFAQAPLTQSIDKPKPFIWWFPKIGDTQYMQPNSFVEYNGSLAGKYVINISYIDGWSYPVTFQFQNGMDGGTKTSRIEAGFEYGFKDANEVRNQLVQEGWGGLIWPKTTNSFMNFNRVIGPSPVYSYSGPKPQCYNDWLQTFPASGTQIFGKSHENAAYWQLALSPELDKTGYSKALHNAMGKPDKYGKYGFYIAPQDQDQGDFENVEETNLCTITIYPLAKNEQ
ncbi:MAG TPA: hypothetical protein QF753_16115 [Victivallales bacterium]|nr:hypothetical protein [Victivallales bacterium]